MSSLTGWMVHLGRTEEQTMIEMIETNAIRPLTAEETLVVGGGQLGIPAVQAATNEAAAAFLQECVQAVESFVDWLWPF